MKMTCNGHLRAFYIKNDILVLLALFWDDVISESWVRMSDMADDKAVTWQLHSGRGLVQR